MSSSRSAASTLSHKSDHNELIHHDEHHHIAQHSHAARPYNLDLNHIRPKFIQLKTELDHIIPIFEHDIRNLNSDIEIIRDTAGVQQYAKGLFAHVNMLNRHLINLKRIHKDLMDFLDGVFHYDIHDSIKFLHHAQNQVANVGHAVQNTFKNLFSPKHK